MEKSILEKSRSFCQFNYKQLSTPRIDKHLELSKLWFEEIIKTAKRTKIVSNISVWGAVCSSKIIRPVFRRTQVPTFSHFAVVRPQ